MATGFRFAYTFAILVLASLSAPTQSLAEAKIAGWNLAGFHKIPWEKIPNMVDAIAEIDPDVILLVEVNPNLAAGAVVAGLQFKGLCYEFHVPNQAKARQEIALLNKCGITVSDVGLIPGSNLDKQGYRDALHATIMIEEFDFILVGLHLKAGRGFTNRRLREQQAEIIEDWIETQVAGTEKDVIVLGDYNMIPGQDDSNFTKLSGGRLEFVSSTELPAGSWSHISGTGSAGNLLDGYAIAKDHTTEYIANSIEVLRTDNLLGMDLTEFKEDVSDNRPVVARFNTDTDDDKIKSPMIRFTEPLVVTPKPDGHTWIVLSDFGYEIGAEGSDDVIDVEIGFHTDFASIPRPLWMFLPRWGKYGNAAVIHDYLYWHQTRDRRQADDIFLEGMGVLGVLEWKKVIYYAVRSFGGIAWYRNKRQKLRRL